MINNEILDYIKTELTAGKSRLEITQKLVAQGGWSRADVDEAFAEMPPATPPQPAAAPKPMTPPQPMAQPDPMRSPTGPIASPNITSQPAAASSISASMQQPQSATPPQSQEMQSIGKPVLNLDPEPQSIVDPKPHKKSHRGKWFILFGIIIVAVAGYFAYTFYQEEITDVLDSFGGETVMIEEV